MVEFGRMEGADETRHEISGRNAENEATIETTPSKHTVGYRHSRDEHRREGRKYKKIASNQDNEKWREETK